MRYAQRGGYTPAEQQRRERLRLEAAELFARGDGINEIARDLRVTEGLAVYRLPRPQAPRRRLGERQRRLRAGPVRRDRLLGVLGHVVL